MAAPSIGTIVLVRFPFSDLTNFKLRPAVVLVDAGRQDWILCQITSQHYTDPKAIEITNDDFVSGSLKRTSYARPSKLFTANEGIIAKQVGMLKLSKFEEIRKAVIEIF